MNLLEILAYPGVSFAFEIGRLYISWILSTFSLTLAPRRHFGHAVVVGAKIGVALNPVTVPLILLAILVIELVCGVDRHKGISVLNYFYQICKWLYHSLTPSPSLLTIVQIIVTVVLAIVLTIVLIIVLTIVIV